MRKVTIAIAEARNRFDIRSDCLKSSKTTGQRLSFYYRFATTDRQMLISARSRVKRELVFTIGFSAFTVSAVSKRHSAKVHLKTELIQFSNYYGVLFLNFNPRLLLFKQSLLYYHFDDCQFYSNRCRTCEKEQ